MATNHTEHYQLSQWVKTDRVRMEDFNEDNRKIDVALGAKTEILVGTYTGDGQESRVISLGFTPKAVFLCMENGQTAYTFSSLTYLCGGVFFPGAPLKESDYYGDHIGAEIVEGGFQVAFGEVSSTYRFTNRASTVYHYLAFR